jgi:hypothetical protein
MNANDLRDKINGWLINGLNEADAEEFYSELTKEEQQVYYEMSKDYPPMDWDKYMGNNHEKIPRSHSFKFGGVSFKKHLEKPLSKELWEDLTKKLQINGLCIYKPGDGIWYIDFGCGHTDITLDEKGLVKDIDYSPYMKGKFA